MKTLNIMTIGEAELEALAVGANVLGSGGGGDPAYDLLIAKENIGLYGPVPLLQVGDIDDQDLVVPIGYMGAPLVCLEKLPSGLEFPLLFELIQAHFKLSVAAILPFEIGGSNAMAPFSVAGRLGLPVLDADTFGRAFPEMHMSVCRLAGLSPSPAFIADSVGNHAVVSSQDDYQMERQLRALTTAMGASAAVCTYPMKGKQAKQTLIKGMLSLAIEIGKAVLAQGGISLAELIRPWQGEVLFSGTLVDIDSRLEDSFLKGKAVVEKGQQTWAIHYQNEFLAVEHNGSYLATTPTIITLFDEENGMPVPIERLRYGLSVSVCTFPAPVIWQTAAGLACVGPEVFGFESIGKHK
ncbi:conserved hypothetical protein [Candidatus Protochlamydia naegleriophila]|uniref:DUF917 domain-containing protein n=1 Tax=Candidatus Protochlamydia naegleriophila TaxID=389348 RepID=A0A0U5K0P5_9BACT|nr:DUF917 domain-containing protein [Candidatus Protochlamydia naegleriophila]CUI15675.1 conserved hypothetical protein [Candidatus Protochlamydia naegleriophila]